MIARDLIEAARSARPEWAEVIDAADGLLWAGALSANAVARQLGWSRRRASRVVRELREFIRLGGHA